MNKTNNTHDEIDDLDIEMGTPTGFFQRLKFEFVNFICLFVVIVLFPLIWIYEKNDNKDN